MKILAADSLATAQGYERRAFALCQSQGNRGSQWCDILTDDTRFAIAWDDSIASVFTPDEIANVIDGDLRMTDNVGNTTGTWFNYTSPQPPLNI